MKRGGLVPAICVLLLIAETGGHAQPDRKVPERQQTLNELIARAQSDLSSPEKSSELVEILSAISKQLPQATPDQTQSILLILEKIRQRTKHKPTEAGTTRLAPEPDAEAKPAEPAVQKPPAPPSPEALALFERGTNAERTGNIADARRFYQAAAAAGYGAANLAVGRLYDPAYLRQIGVIGGQFSDPAMARHWYERAAAQGDPQAQSLISNLPR